MTSQTNNRDKRRAPRRRRQGARRRYTFITDTQRLKFLSLLQHTQMTIKQASTLCEIPYENAKLINKIYNEDGRLYRMNKICQHIEIEVPSEVLQAPAVQPSSHLPHGPQTFSKTQIHNNTTNRRTQSSGSGPE